MIINTHAHFFNLRLLNTDRMRETLVKRLVSDGWPDYVVTLIQKVIDRLLDDDHIDEEKALKTLVEVLKTDARFKDVVTRAFEGVLPANVGFIFHGDTQEATVYGLQKALDKISQKLSDKNDIGQSDFDDIIGFLLLMIKPDMELVADSYFKFTPPDHVAVALMMDITKGGDQDGGRFEEQTEATSQLALAYPGQILPFYAINPLRPSALERLKKAIDLGFVGVKLYPSLGYDPFSDEMKALYAFCAENDLPILTHCNQGGFHFTKEDIQFAAPDRWSEILAEIPGLKICFGHFGGSENLSSAANVDSIASWTSTIIDLMRQYPGVYADLSYHTTPMNGGSEETNYFNNLKTLLQDPIVSGRILWGTDFTLVRQRAREENYWSYFRRNLSEHEFKQISETNAQAYLGLPDQNGTNAGENIKRYVGFLHRHKWAVKRIPSDWVKKTLITEGAEPGFIENPFGASFNLGKRSHRATWHVLLMVLCDQTNPIWRRPPMKHASMRLREYPRWPSEARSESRRRLDFQSLASQINKDLTLPASDGGPGAKRKPSVSYDEALRAIEAQLRKGNNPLADFGPVVDKIYDFQAS